MEVEMVSMAVKKTPIDKMDNNGAALSTEDASLNKSPNIGPERTDIPMAHGMEIMAANFKHECMIFSALILFFFFSSSLFAFLIAVNEAVNVGVKDDAIGWIKAEGKCAIVTAKVL